MFNFFSEESSIPIKIYLVIMEFEQSASMGNSKQSNIELFSFVV